MSRIGELLIKHGIINEKQLDEALEIQKTKGKKLGEILIELGYVSSDDLLWMLSEQANIPFVEVQREMLDAQLLQKFDPHVLYEYNVLPLHESETRIYVAVGDPTNTVAIKAFGQIAAKKVVASGAAPEKIKQLLDEFYEKSLRIGKSTLIRITADNATIEFASESGRQRKKKSPLEIVVKTVNEEGGTDDA